MIHHLSSMHGHIIWYITDGHVISLNSSPSIDSFSCHMIHYLRSCHMLHHLPSMHGHIIKFITFHRCMVMSYVSSPTIDAWSYHMIHHLQSNISFITYHRCLSTSPTIVAWSCHMIHHLPWMPGHVIWFSTFNRWLAMSYESSPTIDAYHRCWSCL